MSPFICIFQLKINILVKQIDFVCFYSFRTCELQDVGHFPLFAFIARSRNITANPRQTL